MLSAKNAPERAEGDDGSASPDLAHQDPVQQPQTDLDRIYEARFSDRDGALKDGVWRHVTRHLERHMDLSRPVLDVATDRGYFIRHCRAAERWATDIRDVRSELDADIRFVCTSGPGMERELPRGHFGTVFMSNYLEHLDSGAVVLEQLRSAYAVMADGGRVVIVQPNIRLVGGRYWDFLDHKTALTEKSLREACELAGFQTVYMATRFLPFTTKSRLPQTGFLVGMYLRCRPAWLVLGKQTLYVGQK